MKTVEVDKNWVYDEYPLFDEEEKIGVFKMYKPKYITVTIVDEEKNEDYKD